MSIRTSRNLVTTAVALALVGTAFSVSAAPVISRLTPPSELFSLGTQAPGTPVTARFIPGQRFDIQATVQPSATNKVSQVEFLVDGVSLGVITPSTGGNTSIVTTGLVTGLATNSAVVSLRGYSNLTAGVHQLQAVATETDIATGTITSSSVANGNFEVVGLTAQGRPVKNIIIMLGDGMGIAHRTAGRIMAKGYAQGKAQGRLAMDTFPYTGMVMTASLDTIVTDSAPGMANYVNGNKANSGQEGVWPDDTTAVFDNPRIEYLSEYLHRTKGTSLGIVTTADVFDATPAANAVHTGDRGQGSGIVDQYLDESTTTAGLTVLLGGGRKWFLPNSTNAVQPVGSPAAYNITNGSQRTKTSDYVLPGDIVAGWLLPAGAVGAQDETRDLIADFQTAGYAYAPDNTTLASVAPSATKLLGLFSFSNMNVAYDKINGRRGASSVVSDYGFPDQPMLDEMTDAALKVLSKNPNGFILMAEGASIDKQAHLMDSDRWMLEVLEFDRAVQKAQEFAAANPDTLVIVTADHECAGAAIIGASVKTPLELQNLAAGTVHTTAAQRDAVVGNYQAAGFPKYAIGTDGYPGLSGTVATDITGKLLIGYGANADRYETWLTNPQPTQDTQQPFYKTGTNNPYPNLASYPGNAGVRNSSATNTPGTSASGASGQVGVFITGQTSATSGGNQATHTASDVPLSAYGRGSYQFTGVFDNTDVFFKFAQAIKGVAR
jgi:alkaline phosphatase